MPTEAGNAAIQAMYQEDFGTPQESVEAEETPIAQPEAVAEAEAQHETVEAPEVDLEPEIPQDIMDLLEEPDFEAEAEAEVVAEAAGQSDDEQYTEFDDPQLQAERKARIAAEKKAAHYEKMRVRENIGKWKAEAERYFPHSKPFIDKIEANSRRAFLKQASAYHETIKAHVGTVAPKSSDEEREKLKAEIRAELEASWGKPMVGPGSSVPAEAAERQRAYEEAKAKGDRQGMIRARGTVQKIFG